MQSTILEKDEPRLRFQREISDTPGVHKRPSTWSILWTDYACCSITGIVPMVFLIGLAIKLTGTIPGSRGKPDTPVEPEVASMVLACAVAVSLFLAAIVVLRVARIRRLFDEGREVEASVRKVAYLRSARGASRQKLELEFELHGIPHVVSFTFVRSSKTPAFSEGARISVLVDPANPKRAVPLTLYGDSGAAQSGSA